ncbi:MAG: hypothetical protein L6R42_007563 [Xanthoria sp. 1 TBL-2021]|nr:MAG: hypothetical protein L6R42_007563 [Xanthoria sp. 1 TBL-2021]
MGTEGNWGPPIIILTAVFLAIVLFVLALRIFTRVWIVHAFWWDDFTIILAVLGTTIGAALDFVEVHYGFGKHQQFLSDHEIRQFRKYTYGEWIQTFATLMWTKVSICLFLIRLPQSKALKRPLQWTVAFLLFSNTICTTILIMQCQPLHAAWDDNGRCMSVSAMEALVLTQAVISVVSDFAFAALPVFFLWHTQIDFRTKVGLWVLMGLGVLTGFFCLVRTVINNQSFPEDVTYGGIVNWVWRLFEVSIGIIAACVPTLRPLYPWLKKRIRGGHTSIDPNIHFPLSDKPQPWIESAEEAKHARREEVNGSAAPAVSGKSRSPQPTAHHEHRGTNRDTLGEELVRDGIINTDEPDQNNILPVDIQKHKPERAETALGQEMYKYGIDDSLV